MINTEELVARNTKVLAEKQPGDIIFFHPYTFDPFGDLILLVTGQYYSHGVIVIEGNTIIESDPFYGIHTDDVSAYYGSFYLDLFRLKTNTPDIVDAALKYQEWGYDYGNVLWAGFGIIWYRLTGISIFTKLKNPASESETVDSEEFIDRVFRDVQINLRPDIPTTNITAQNLADSPLLEKINF